MKFVLYILILMMSSMVTLMGSRIKDLTHIEGTRDDQLIRYGLVVGLAGQGDSNGIKYTSQALVNALKALKVNVNPDDIKSKNVAAVMITSNIGPFIREGSKIDITVSSIGDAKSLQGGVLLQTPLVGADGVVYAVGQGPIAVGGFLGGSGGEGGATVQQNHPTVGIITSGAIVEREIPTEFMHHGSLNLLLESPDFVSAVRVADAVNKIFPGTSQAMNSATINVLVPPEYRGQVPNFIASIGELDVIPDLAARVIINERTGTIVATSNVRISTVAISNGSLTISISNTQGVSQPNALSNTGDTTTYSNTETNVDETKGVFQVVEDLPTIERLTAALNALGVSTREMMSILQAIKSAGALHAELILN